MDNMNLDFDSVANDDGDFDVTDPEIAEQIRKLDLVISENLKLVREINNVTRGDLAKKMELTDQEVEAYETGEPIPAALLAHFAVALDVSIEVFYAGM